MLEDLVQTIEILQKRIKEHKDDIESYESRTRVTLIDPMLCALGWDVSDPTVVEIEPKVSNGWADYALLGSNRKTVVFVEAKKLADKDSPLAQVVSYVVTENIQNNTNVRYCVSTNGDAWVVYDVTAQKSVMSCSIAKEDTAKCALQFLGLWRRSLSDGVFDPPIEPVIALVDDSGLSVPPGQPISGQPIVGWTPLSAEFQSKHRPPPTAIKLPNGQEVAIKAWRSILVETALWLYQSSLLTQENCGAAIGAKRLLFSLDGKHKGGTPFKSPIQIANTGIILEANFSSSDIVMHTRRLLENYDQDSSKLLLKLQESGTS